MIVSIGSLKHINYEVFIDIEWAFLMFSCLQNHGCEEAHSLLINKIFKKGIGLVINKNLERGEVLVLSLSCLMGKDFLALISQTQVSLFLN